MIRADADEDQQIHWFTNFVEWSGVGITAWEIEAEDYHINGGG